MLAEDLRFGLDAVSWAAERCGVVLDSVQAALLARRGHRELLCCTRQWGKTTVVALGALHEGCYVERSKTVIVAPSQRQSSLLLADIERFAKRADVPLSKLPGEDPGLRLPAGVVIALPSSEATTRGIAGATWLVIDEAAQVSNGLYFSTSAYLATTNGRITLMSTPFGQRGFFYQEHEAGGFRVTTVKASECPRISAEFLAERRRSLPASWYEQEYECKFVDVQDGVFDHSLVLQSLSDEVLPLWE